MKLLSFIVLMFLTLSTSAQIYQNTGISTEYGRKFKRIKVDSTFTLPQDTSLRSSLTDAGAITYQISDESIYVWNGNKWNRIASGTQLALDSAYMRNDTTFFPITTGGELAVKVTGLPQANVNGLVDSILTRPSFSVADKRYAGIGQGAILKRQQDPMPFVFDTSITALSANGTGWEGNLAGLGFDIAFDPKVGKYVMLYSAWNGGGDPNAGTASIGVATSSDLFTWVKSGSNPVFPNSGTPGTFDSASVTFPQLLYTQEDSTWHMYYAGFPNLGFEKGQSKIGHATAKSLLGPWTRSSTPVFTAPSGFLLGGDYIFRPCVVKVDTLYYMFFNGGPYGDERLGYATATNPAGPFTAAPIPLFSSNIAPWNVDNFASDPDIIQKGNYWYMLYWGRGPTVNTNYNIGVTYTTVDSFPLGWKPYSMPVTIPGSTNVNLRPVTVTRDEKTYLFYFVGNLSTGSIKVAYYNSGRLPATINATRLYTDSYNYRALQTNVQNAGSFATWDFLFNGARRAYFGFNNTNSTLTIGLATGTAGGETEIPIMNFKSSSVAIGMTTPSSTFDIGGSLATGIRTVTTNYTIAYTDYTVLMNNTGSASITLPAASSVPRRVIVIKKVSANDSAVTITPVGADLIDGMATWPLSYYGSTVTIQSDGGAWRVIVPPVNVLPFRNTTVTTALRPDDYGLGCTNTVNIVVNLPIAATYKGKIYYVKKATNNAATVTITANGSDQIDSGGSTKVLTLFNSAVGLQSNGSSWNIIFSHAAATTL